MLEYLPVRRDNFIWLSQEYLMQMQHNNNMHIICNILFMQICELISILSLVYVPSQQGFH